MEEVLVVEDDPRWRRELKRMLQEAGYEVTVAATALEARESLRKGTIRLAVVDMSLIPGDPDDRQGREIMTAIKQVPLLCISGYLGPGEASEVVSEGLAKWFFDKSQFDKEKFLEQVERGLTLGAAERRARWREIERRLGPGD